MKTTNTSTVDPYRPPQTAHANPSAQTEAAFGLHGDLRNHDKVHINLANMPAETAAAHVTQFFAGQKYRLEDGQPANGVYGIGNAVLRVLFGAFVKRYKFKVQLLSTESGLQLEISKAMNGAMGGIIGYQKYKKEFERICVSLSNHFVAQQSNSPQPPAIS